jgi:NitT/TauT family transport system substrate-binding protein
MSLKKSGVYALVVALIGVVAPAAQAEKLTVSQYGRIPATLPWAVALKNGYFKDAGLDIDGITAGAGGGTSVRNMMASDLPFAEAATPAVLAAIRAGMDLKIVMATSNHIGELAWVATADSGVKSIRDLAGKKVGFSNPRSTTEMVVRYALEREGLASKVEALSTGGLGPGITALTQNAIGAAPLTDPVLTLQPQKYNILFYAHEYYPKFTWSVGVTTREFAEKNPQKVRALVQIHRKAVDFMHANRAETAKIYADVWEINVADAEKMLPKFYDWNHWGRGDFSKEGLEAVERGLLAVGEIDKPIDWSKSIDQRFLDEDLRRPL